MGLTYDHFISSIFMLLIVNTLHCSSHPSSPQVPHDTLNPQPLSYLKNLVGVQRGNRINGIAELKKYLSRLGYMDANFNSTNADQANLDLFDDKLESALEKYQLFFKLKTTRILDFETVSNLLRPRCGVPDLIDHQNPQRQNWTKTNISALFNFFPGAPKWPPTKRTLTYEFLPGTRSDVARPIYEALSEWSTFSVFNFVHVLDYNQADIKISFQIRDHGDGNPFDGPGGILAHAFAPTDGRLHYDGDDKWVDGVVPGKFDLQTVGLHELGHVLGLAHSTDPTILQSQTDAYIRFSNGIKLSPSKMWLAGFNRQTKILNLGIGPNPIYLPFIASFQVPPSDHLEDEISHMNSNLAQDLTHNVPLQPR